MAPLGLVVENSGELVQDSVSADPCRGTVHVVQGRIEVKPLYYFASSQPVVEGEEGHSVSLLCIGTTREKQRS